MSRSRPLIDFEHCVDANVERYGWHCNSISIFPDDTESEFSYTVGFHHSYGQPEFIVFGLDPVFAYSVMKTLADAAAAGKMYPLDQPCADFVKGYEFVFVEVPRARFDDFVFSALRFYAGRPFPLYQVVWPDRDGRYPWHENAAADFKQQQPVLGCVQ